MAGLFGHTFVSQYGASPDGDGAGTWATALTGVTPEQIAAGLSATLALGGEFPPSAPKFRALCFGIPSPAAVRAAIRTRELTPFVRLVWTHLDAYQFHRADQRKADRMLDEAYELAVDHVMRGGAFPAEPIGEIEQAKEPKPVRASPEKARPYVESLAKLLGETNEPEAAA